MHIDSHFAANYAVARCSGLDHKRALIMAYGGQFVDDCLDGEKKRFDDGSALQLFNTGHGLVGSVFCDYDISNKVWIGFHFPPSGEGKTLDSKLRVNYKAPNAMFRELEDAVIAQKDDFGMAILSHYKLDMYSHTHFSGAWSDSNIMYVRADGWFERLKQFALRLFGITVGHPQVICKPDDPYRKFKMKRAKTKEHISRDNQQIFSDALDGLHDLYCRYSGSTDHKMYLSMKPLLMAEYQTNTDPDGYNRIIPWYTFLTDAFKEFCYDDIYDETLWIKKALIKNKEGKYFKSCWIGSELQKFDSATRFHYNKIFEILTKHNIIVDHYINKEGKLKINKETEKIFFQEIKN